MVGLDENISYKLLKELVSKLELIQEDSSYKSVWWLAQMHGGPYKGPTYVEELARAKEHINNIEDGKV